MNIVVSACLLGHNCKYNGKNNYCPQVAALAKEHRLIPVCPEMLGGLPCPRIPCEIRENAVVNQNGEDQTQAFEAGAQKALAIALENQAEMAVVQPRSPSCGCGRIYDGTFSGTLKEGDGLFVQALKKAGIPIMNADSYLSCH